MTDSTGSDKDADTAGDAQHGGAEGHASDIPEESPASESGVALSEQVAQRGTEGERDTR